MDTGFLRKDELINNLWSEYQKTSEYKVDRQTKAISKENPIIIRREERGLKEIFINLQKELANRHVIYRDNLLNRDKGEWVSEWLGWHKTLFKYILQDAGKYRRLNVRFGDPGDELLHHIPDPQFIGPRLAELAGDVQYFLHNSQQDIKRIVTQIAIVHYRFISIHPFLDGNGRIGRLLIDQLSIANNLPMVMGGYPRTDMIQRQRYHDAINACIHDTNCTKLASWILDKIDDRINTTA